MIFGYLIPLVMVGLNLISSYQCLNKRKTLLFTFLVYGATTIIMLLFVYTFDHYILIDNPNIGNGVYLLFGLIYFIPIKVVSEQKPKEVLVIMFSTWIYTLFVFVIANQVSMFFPIEQKLMIAFIVQIALHAATYSPFLKFMKRKFVFVLSNINKQTMNILFIISLLWFALLIMMNYSLTSGANNYLNILLFFMFGALVLLSYKNFHSSVFLSKETEKLTMKSYRDHLTNLKNRACLMKDTTKNIQQETPFHLIYLDLDSFKMINDDYGHEVGDEYLVVFSDKTLEEFQLKNNFYRISGDEFIILSYEKDLEPLLNQLDIYSKSKNLGMVDFKGFSFGYSSYPKDGNKLRELLSVADAKMYIEKRNKQENEMLI